MSMRVLKRSLYAIKGPAVIGENDVIVAVNFYNFFQHDLNSTYQVTCTSMLFGRARDFW